MDAKTILDYLLQQAPAVVVLALVAYRLDKRLEMFFEWCLKEVDSARSGDDT